VTASRNPCSTAMGLEGLVLVEIASKMAGMGLAGRRLLGDTTRRALVFRCGRHAGIETRIFDTVFVGVLSMALALGFFFRICLPSR